MTPTAELDRLHARLAGRFTRSEPRRRVRHYLAGLTEGPRRKNGWTLARQGGDASPDGMQRLLRSADWDVEAVRDDVRDYVLDHLRAPDAVLIVAGLAFPKRGTRSAGVARQPVGTAGHVENCQLGVFLAYRSSRGEALIDRRLHLPRSWTDDRVRCRAAGIPDDIAYARPDRLAEQMIERALADGAGPARVHTNEPFGLERCFRQARERAGLDSYQVRDWRAWHAHTTLSMAALAAVVVSDL
ncbi:IS701 family transposase [Paractinoplanes maris]|uniref:IS701 family transposase n=1 Tax=Paractinoplanes maris TaxID=1734446 RepID=UPI002021A715|nr:transposase [Actinoplanes maris]